MAVEYSMEGTVVLDGSEAGCFSAYRSGQNVGIFVSAGWGKSVVLRAIVAEAILRHGYDAMEV